MKELRTWYLLASLGKIINEYVSETCTLIEWDKAFFVATYIETYSHPAETAHYLAQNVAKILERSLDDKGISYLQYAN